MKNYSKILIPSFLVCAVGIMIVSIVLVVNGIKNYASEKSNFDYTLDEVFDGDISPVSKVQNNSIIKPFISTDVKVDKYFYDFEDESDKQEDSIVYYENTYMQNTGVDYTDTDEFDIVSVLDGEIISIENKEYYGKTITIKHNDNLTTVYSSVDNILPNVGYKVSQGEIIASSKLIDDEKSLFHFEVYYKGNLIDPEEIYTLSVSELK